MTIANFEKSGAAYVVYAACRARSILRRHGRKPMRAEEIKEFALDQGEVNLRLNIQLLPCKIAMAARQANPVWSKNETVEKTAIRPFPA